MVPGKAMDDDKQRQAQQEFHDQQLQPILDEAKQGKHIFLFVDSAHFVMGAFLGVVCCFCAIAAVCQRAQTPQCLGVPMTRSGTRLSR